MKHAVSKSHVHPVLPDAHSSLTKEKLINLTCLNLDYLNQLQPFSLNNPQNLAQTQLNPNAFDGWGTSNYDTYYKTNNFFQNSNLQKSQLKSP